MNELALLKDMHESQRKWRKTSLFSFIATVLIASFILIVLGKEVSGILVQIVMILGMLSVAGLVFLDVVSFVLNKKFFKQDVIHEYLFKHSKAEDINEDVDIVMELINDRRAAAQSRKR